MEKSTNCVRKKSIIIRLKNLSLEDIAEIQKNISCENEVMVCYRKILFEAQSFITLSIL